MVTEQPEMQHPSLDRLDFGRLRRLLADLGVQAGYWAPGTDEIKGLAPDVPLCQKACATGRHCQQFLLQLARDAQADPDLSCRSCMSGAYTLVARLGDGPKDRPVAMGCFVTAAVAGSPAARDVLHHLGIGDDALAAPLADHVRYGAQDLGWLTAAFTRIAQEWYARSCEQTREVEALSQSLAETYEELTFIYRLNAAMNVTASPKAYFQELAEELRELLAAAGVLIVLNRDAQASHAAAGAICTGPLPVPAEVLTAAIDMDRLARNGYHVMAMRPDGTAGRNGEPGTCQVLSTVISRNDKRLGYIAAIRATGQRRFNNIDVTRVSSIARSAAVVLENFRLYDNLRQLFLGTLKALTRSIEAKDPYTCGHSERVAMIARRTLQEMGASIDETDRVYLCGLLHDVGKIGVAEAVLRKPGRLTDEEFQAIKRHPVVGATILDGILELADVLPGVLHHHERMDGRGYPGGLVGEDIPLYARVLAVADTFDAMTSARTYRGALSPQVAIEEIQRHSGTQFDPRVVEAFLRINLQQLLAELETIHTDRRAGDAAHPPVAPTALAAGSLS